MTLKRKVAHSQEKDLLSRIEDFHPYKMVLLLTLIGTSTIFLFMTLGYIASEDHLNSSEFSLPIALIPGIVVLLFSSFTISPIIDAYLNERFDRLVKFLWASLMLGLIFSGCQVIGWREMIHAGALIGGDKSATYLLLMSGLHGIHLLVGLVGLGWFSIQWSGWRQDPVKLLIAQTNPFELLKLHLLTLYWHFLTISWITLFLFFLFFIYP